MPLPEPPHDNNNGPDDGHRRHSGYPFGSVFGFVEHAGNGGAFAFLPSLMAIRGEKDNQPDRSHRHQ